MVTDVFPAVERDDASAAFFDAAAGQRLLVLRCAGCEKVLGPEARTCPACGNADLVPHVASGAAQLVSWVVVHHAPVPALADAVPYASAVVELEEGPWLITRLVDVAPSTLREGLPLRAQFREPADEGEVLPAFGPVPT